ncbi:MAG: 16S rRNA (guanine(966)-N(2))-methyltransferase RsmD [Methylococcales bacterium]|nr:16S rRNA (guanine(966)-N(2))-methyltransferase RsmD [Methylococcales bacterium]
MQNKLSIIGGNWRSRKISFEDADGLRPTPARVRETLFNWLQYDILGSRCLDLYAGSGALSFEAVSRGAKSVVQVENNPIACRSLKTNALSLGAEQLKIVQSDVFRYLAGNAQAFDIVFIDPPFSLNLAAQTCQWLEDKGWLAPYAKIYVETERTNVDTQGVFQLQEIPENWRLLKQKTAGEVMYHLFERVARANTQ